jgi:GT2 family glycosyltransferase
MNISPIIIFTYNRLDHLDTLIRSLEKNNLYNKSKILVFSDGPKNDTDIKKIKKIRIHLKKKLIPNNSEIIERSSNYGLSKNIIGGINHVFKTYDQAIILEDDLEVSPVFLNYMNDALNIYSNSENVASISGYMYPIDPKKFSNNYFFLKLIESWGWGTWKRAWNNFEIDSLKLKKEIDKKKLINEFDFQSGISYYKMLNDNINGLNDSWAIRWYASTFLKNMITLFPRKSFVKNIGIDNSGENCNYTTVYDSLINLEYEPVKKNNDCNELLLDRSEVKSFFGSVKYKRYLETIISKIKNFIR